MADKKDEEEEQQEQQPSYSGGGVNVQAKSISEKLSALKGQIAKLNELSNLISDKTEKMKDSWQGETGEYVLGEIEKYKEVFDKIKSQNSKYTKYLENMISQYSALDSSQSTSMEERNL